MPSDLGCRATELDRFRHRRAQPSNPRRRQVIRQHQIALPEILGALSLAQRNRPMLQHLIGLHRGASLGKPAANLGPVEWPVNRRLLRNSASGSSPLDRSVRPVGNRCRRYTMPTVHPQVQKARDLMPLIAAAADENDDNPRTHQTRRRSPDRWRVLHHAEDEIRRRNGAETLDLRPSDRGARQRGWIDRVGGVPKQRLLDHQRVSPCRTSPRRFSAGRTGSSPGDRPARPTKPHRSKAAIASPANGAS